MQDLLAEIRRAFGDVPRPQRFTVGPSSTCDDEIERANEIFKSRDPETLQASEIGINAGWPENFLTNDAIHYFMPAFVRLALENEHGDQDGFSLDDFLSILSPDLLRTFKHSQRVAMASVLKAIRSREDERGQELLDRRLKRLKA